jgi:hypothetical protein
MGGPPPLPPRFRRYGASARSARARRRYDRVDHPRGHESIVRGGEPVYRKNNINEEPVIEDSGGLLSGLVAEAA